MVNESLSWFSFAFQVVKESLSVFFLEPLSRWEGYVTDRTILYDEP